MSKKQHSNQGGTKKGNKFDDLQYENKREGTLV
jgi:hypothetical protein